MPIILWKPSHQLGSVRRRLELSASPGGGRRGALKAQMWGQGSRKGWQELGPGGLGGGAKNLAVTACVSGTELRSLDPEKGGCFAVHLHLAMTGAELAAVSALLSHVIKLTQSFLTLDFAHGETEMYPGIGGNKSLEAPLPLVLSFPSWLGFTDGLYVPEAGQENSRGIRGTDATPGRPLPRAAFDHPAAPAARFSLSLLAAPWPTASPPQPGILRGNTGLPPEKPEWSEVEQKARATGPRAIGSLDACFQGLWVC